MPGVTNIAFHDVAARLAKQQLKPFAPFNGMSKPLKVKCLKCGYKWVAPTIRQFHKYVEPCPKCAEVAKMKPRTDVAQIDDKLRSMQLARVGPFTGIGNTCKLQCNVCSRQWSPRVNDVINGGHGCSNGCVSGQPSRKWTDREFRAKVKELHPNVRLETPYAGMLTKVTAHCKTHSVTFDTLARNFIRGTGCPECAKFSKFFHAEGKTVMLRGREPQALSWILKSTKFKMADVVLQPPYFEYRFGGKVRRYIPDFLIDDRIVVEVKSLESAGLGRHYFYESDGLFDMLKAKAKAVRDAGYQFRLLIMEGNGAKINMPKNWYLLSKETVLNKLRQG